MRDNILKILVYFILISNVKAQFNPFELFGGQLTNFPILSDIFGISCRTDGRQNEVFSSCGNNACQNTCRNPTVTNGCSGACVAGCICASGYLRNSQNRCVLPQNCDVGPTVSTQTCFGANEMFSTCGDNGCQPTCANQNVGFCNPTCGTPRCICASGYVRSAGGNCILPINCPSTGVCTRSNEVFSQCGNDGCQLTCNRRQIGLCIRICSTPGCVCATGFVRDDAGNCISPSLCPATTTTTTCTGQNEIFSTCGNDGCQRSCDRLIINSCVPSCGSPGCICAFGFVRNSLGVCVFPTSCPLLSCSGPNEVFSLCGNDGCQRSCSRMDVSLCTPICSSPGCVCGAGFVRNGLNVCVSPINCPSTTITCTKPNEFLSICGNDACQRSCTRLDVTGCTPRCNSPGCICVAGFVRNANGDCVLPSSCPVTTCTGPNEVFSACGNDGCQKTCSRLETTGCRSVCTISGCVCAPGFVKNANAGCVLPSACPPITCLGGNEIFSACGNDGCQRSCTRLDNTGCSPFCTSSGCICTPGYIRNDLGVCALPATCPVVTCNGANEIFSACGNDGCQRSCTRLDVTGCSRVCSLSGCVCLPGYVRNALNQCVAVSTCPPVTCSGSNEIFSACGEDGCQTSCTRQVATGCQRVCIRSACVCLPGFVRNSVGACVPPSTCPPVTCSPNEVFSACGNDGCERSCSRQDVTGCSGVCVTSGCVCAPGYVRNAGQCVLPSSCPPISCTGTNEMFSACGNDGCQRTCDRLDVTGCTRQCTASGCICMPGYVRNSLGLCVLPFTCPVPTCPGPNEIYSLCGNDGCQKSCTRLEVTGCVPVCSRSGCICAAGYVRNAIGVCMQSNTCPLVVCSGNNEIFSACGDDGCQKKCNRLDLTGCNSVCTASGCICKAGFVRNSAGACIDPATCPILTCTGANEILSTCGNDGCQRTCLRLDTTGCVPACGPSACVCAPGYVRDSTNACVTPNMCPPVTCSGTNEIFSACGDDGCQRSCTKLDTTGCNRVCSASACVCLPGYVRNALNQCVEPVQCPPVTCNAPNEIFSECGNNGCQKSCTKQDVTGCVPACSTSGCICNVGYVRNSAGECVTPNLCPIVTCTGTFEVFSACGDDRCQRSCMRLDVTGCNRVCSGSGCICQTGYVRNSAGACVLPSTCPNVPCSGLNEMFSPCGDDGCQKSCRRPETTGCAPVCRLSGCICLQGYVRNDAGMCVLPSTCPTISCTASNEVLSPCGEDGCQPTCMRLQTTGCTRVCNMAGCICRPGTVRNSAGTCVAIASCPPVTCGANEMFSQCGDDGCQRTCARRDTTGCAPVCRASGCICLPGYGRNIAGVCELLSACPAVQCPVNERFSLCGEHNCIESCSVIPSINCDRVCVASGCICNAGRFRNANRMCVPQRDCTPTCSTNEIFSACGNENCRPTCTNQSPAACACSAPACICQRNTFFKTSTNRCVISNDC